MTAPKPFTRHDVERADRAEFKDSQERLPVGDVFAESYVGWLSERCIIG